MSKYIIFLIIGFYCLQCKTMLAQAQHGEPEIGAFVAVHTVDGNEFWGKLISRDSVVVVLQTENFGDMTIRQEAIRSMRTTTAPKKVGGKIWFESPHSVRYFASTSAFGLRKGEGSIDNTLLFFNQLSYGLSDRFTLGAGVAPMFIFEGPLLLWLTPKYSIPIVENKVQVAVGALYGHAYSSYESDEHSFRAFYTQATLGSRDANLTLGVGWFTRENTWMNAPILSLSGLVRMNRWLALVGESYFLTGRGDEFILFCPGLRFMGRRLALDAGVATSIEQGEAYPIPWGSLHIPLNIARNYVRHGRR